MRDTKAHRANTIQSYSVNVTFGYTFVHSKRASYSSQPDVLPGHRTFAHSGSLRAAGRSKSASYPCPPFRNNSFPLIYKPEPLSALCREAKPSFSFSHEVCGFIVCIISPLTQFVNGLIPVFFKLSFLHDAQPAFAASRCAVPTGVILLLLRKFLFFH